MIKFILPLYVDLPISKKARSAKNKKRLANGKPFNRYWLNLNQYRNWGRFLEHNIKESFEPIEKVDFKAERIKVSYHIERRGKPEYDVRNIDSIVDKYFMDWLVQEFYIPDDDFKHVCYGESDGENGCEENRVIATIEIVEEIG